MSYIVYSIYSISWGYFARQGNYFNLQLMWQELPIMQTEVWLEVEMSNIVRHGNEIGTVFTAHMTRHHLHRYRSDCLDTDVFKGWSPSLQLNAERDNQWVKRDRWHVGVLKTTGSRVTQGSWGQIRYFS